jgi:hypothetical protein
VDADGEGEAGRGAAGSVLDLGSIIILIRCHLGVREVEWYTAAEQERARSWLLRQRQWQVMVIS